MTMTSMQSDAGLLPLVIGTSGHRDPSDPGKVLAQVERILAELDDLAPNVPFCVMSPLASGGDRIVVEAALRLRERRRASGAFSARADGGVELIALLPLKVDDYRLDFETADDRAEFERLFAQMDQVLELPIHEGANFETVVRDGVAVSAVDGGRFARDRNEGFERLGRFTAIHSHIIIAMWNGWNTAVVGAQRTGIGGTSAVVHFCRGGNAGDKVGGVPLHADLSPILVSPQTPVAWVFTARQSDAGKGRMDLEAALQRQLGLSPNSRVAARIEAAARWSGVEESHAGGPTPVLAEFDLSSSGQAIHGHLGEFKELCESLGDLDAEIELGESPLKGVPADYIRADKGLAMLASMMHRLDSLAIAHKRQFEWNGRLALGTLVAAILSFQFFSSWSKAIFILLYLALLLGSRAPRRWAKSIEWKRAESRCLAELVRVQIACRLAGARTLVSDFFDERRLGRISRLSLLVRAILVRAMLAPPAQPEPYSKERLKVMTDSFLSPQIDFRSEAKLLKLKQSEEAAEWWLRKARRATLGTSILALAVAVLHESDLAARWGYAEITEDVVLPLLNLTVAVSLLCVFFIDTRRSLFGARENVEAAEGTRPLFETARVQLERGESGETIRAVVARICNAMTDEQLEWYIQRRNSAELDALG
jgi:hypothetical protein